MEQALSFDDILLVPQYSDISTRKEVDTSVSMRALRKLQLPIVSSPMDTITGENMACAISAAGGIGVLHRYNTIEEQCTMVMNITSKGHDVGAAIGVGGDFLERATALAQVGVSFLCVDVAHGHHLSVKGALKTLKETFGDSMHIMAGNVATLQAFHDLADWGAD